MARTYRSTVSTKWWKKENKVARRMTRNKVRRENKNALRHGDYETEYQYRGTEGRLTH